MDKQSVNQHGILIFILVIALLLVVVTLQNYLAVSVKLLFWNFEISLALLMFVCVILGILISFIYTLNLLNNKNNQLREKDEIIKKNKKTIYDSTKSDQFHTR